MNLHKTGLAALAALASIALSGCITATPAPKVTTPPPAPALPELTPVQADPAFTKPRSLLSSARKPLGTGTCKGTEGPIWAVDGGVIVEVGLEARRCSFKGLILRAGKTNHVLSAVNDSFGMTSKGAFTIAKGNTGQLYFKTAKPLSEKTFTATYGIWESDCPDGSCFTDQDVLAEVAPEKTTATTAADKYPDKFPSAIELPAEFLIKVRAGCYAVNPFPVAGETATWSGECKNGRISGYGKLTWYLNGKLNEESSGIYENGFNLNPFLNTDFDRTAQITLPTLDNKRDKDGDVCQFAFPMFSSTKVGIKKLMKISYDCRQNPTQVRAWLNGQLFAIYEGRTDRHGYFPDNGKITFFTGTAFKSNNFPSGFLLASYMMKEWNSGISIMTKSKERATGEAQIAADDRRKQLEYDNNIARFRANLAPGDEASAGIVIEVKGTLVKVQTNESQCTQRNYNGECTNYISTPAQKWYKRSDLYPR
jgi:hypothetical protein